MAPPYTLGYQGVNDILDRKDRGHGGAGPAKDHVNSDQQSFELPVLASQEATPSGMKEEIVLLSWFLVLLRTREGGQISFEWTYDLSGIGSHLSMSEVVPDLQEDIANVATAIRRHIKSSSSTSQSSSPRSIPLIMSTSAFSHTAEEAKDEGAIHLELRFSNNRLDIRPLWTSDNMLPYTVSLYIETLAETITKCLSGQSQSVQECLCPTSRDLRDIWGWNGVLPPAYRFGMHEVISERAQKHPSKTAISSWDGELTYGEVEHYSNFIASSLRGLAVQLHDFIPVCFEKSCWTIVAVLAVMKAGGTMVMMDPTLPLARLQNMATQVGAKTMLASLKQQSLSKEILPDGNLLVIEQDTFKDIPAIEQIATMPTVPGSALMYLIFTSGSTGTPKGVKISHETYTSSAFPRAKAVGYDDESRVLDFASYAFDVSIDSMLLTLGNGGCLCIPSDEDRLNDINGAIRRMQVNYAGITPSMARILEPDVIASLSGLGLGGEAASPSDVNLWGQDARIIIGYGPCECTIGCTVNSSAATGRDYISIGTGNGAAIWIVDPNDHEILMPVGAVGELLVEGPIVGQGYLNDPDKTAAAFIEDPKWLVEGHDNFTGRQGRLYKTGDLGKYDPDGSGGIVFAGRKDTQVKLRGQRVELGEIESQLRARLPSEISVIVEVIKPDETGGQPTLVAFVTSQSLASSGQDGISSIQFSEEQKNCLSTANSEIATALPRYMVPTAYIPVNCLPVLISGKTDRRRLRQFGATVDLRQLDLGTTTAAARDLTELEKQLRQTWGQVLKLEAEGIRPDDNFVTLGGDSLAAMKLVSVCRDQGLELTVANIFGHPTLAAMAEITQLCVIETQSVIPSFSLISQSRDTVCAEASKIYGFDVANIEDMYPCTPTQESLFTFSLKSVKAYVAQRVACIPSHIALDAWKGAWEKVVRQIPILRTRVAQLQEPGLQQVVLIENIAWKHAEDLNKYLDTDREIKMNLGESLARYAIIDDQKDGKRYMVWTVHHVLYDGWSEPIILKKISDALMDQEAPSPETQMRDFVKYVRDTNEAAMGDFWRRELSGAVGPQFPRLPSRDYLPTPDGFVEHQISLETTAGSVFTMATLIRGAWALVASQYTRSDDVIFGETLTGRDIPLAGVEGIIGPLIATLPVRINVNRHSTVESYLHSVQKTILARVPYQHMGMQNIRKVSRDAQHACEAGTGLVIQPEPDNPGSELGVEQGDVVREALHFNPYPLMLACGIRKGGFRICASFDTGLIEVAQMKRILAQLEMACQKLSKGLTHKVGEISCMSEVELSQIWQWNQTPPLSLGQELGSLRADASVKPGTNYPRPLVPWVCDPRNPSLLSPIGCVGELWFEGALLSDENIESPAWLEAGCSDVAGRRGKVQSTGDMVHLGHDGSLVFVGRKEDVVPVYGHAVDIADVEANVANQLPSGIIAAATVVQYQHGSSKKEIEQELVVLIELPSVDGERVMLLSQPQEVSCEVSGQQLSANISTSIPVSFAVALKKLNKFAQDNLPSYMVPSAYVVVDRMPFSMENIDRALLHKLASSVPRSLLNGLRGAYKEAWGNGVAQSNLTPSENILRSAWAKILGLAEEKIDVDDNFFRLGGDSVLAMKLVSSLRAHGHGLTVADIFQNMRLTDAARVLKLDRASTTKIKAYAPFSLLDTKDTELFLSDIVRPKLANPSWKIRDVYPVTDSQALDIKGTVELPRTSVQYTMLYFDSKINNDRLMRACNDLVKTHDILRTVFIKHESTFLQVVLDSLYAPVMTQKAEKELEQAITDVCSVHIEREFQLGSSFFKVLHVQGNDGRECLIFGLSHALYDGVSLPRLLQDLETLYTKGNIVDYEPFSTYMARISDEKANAKAVSYWTNLLTGSSMSIMEGKSGKPTDKAVFHTKPVDISLPIEEITTASLLTAAWALVLARVLKKSDVTFGSVTSGRMLDLAGAENVIGPCYQLSPVRVPFQPQWTAMDLLKFVQKQSAESAAYDYLGFNQIAEKCAQWSSDAQGFDSLVHHQDWDDFDTMTFAGGTYKVDILNPHGDAPHPLKIVSYVREGQMHVGVVGCELDSPFVDEVLGKLVDAVRELGARQSEKLLDAE
ncbi:hypothetical protein N7532_001555 [Penicillium argentinense]|uniref:Carrier domain-containing protein n=1 Tax=Penicillium argentinense TaxID=1131581 RepID=A0A9W9G3J4_9EURO|nr:uncharacterized protein N7532_001555 [Penicillium argentinense]KAJ5111020.1 hypothetical protein N7532_001555 [Penicillium argentinense]